LAPNFHLGETIITLNAEDKLNPGDDVAARDRHLYGEWGNLGVQDAAENEHRLREEDRLVSDYRDHNGAKIYTITEAADQPVASYLLQEVSLPQIGPSLLSTFFMPFNPTVRQKTIVEFGLFCFALYIVDWMNKSIYSEEYKRLLKRLRRARLAVGLTQEELAERLGQTQSFVSKCERGERRLDVLELAHFCWAIRIELDELLPRSNERQFD